MWNPLASEHANRAHEEAYHPAPRLPRQPHYRQDHDSRVVKTVKGWEILAYPDETDEEAIARVS